MTLKDFEEALKEWGLREALCLLAELRAAESIGRSQRPPRRITSRKMTPALAAEVIRLNAETRMNQHEIAGRLGVNQGRVNEVLKRGKWIEGPSA